MRTTGVVWHITEECGAAVLIDTLPNQTRRPWAHLWAVPLGCSLLGLAAALWTHLESWGPTEWGGQLRSLLFLQLLLFVLLLPAAAELLARRRLSAILQAPRGLRLALYGLLAYYAVHFYFFLYWAADHLTSSATWRMISSGWLLLFSIAALYYRTRFTR